MKIAPINTDMVTCIDIEAMAEDPDFSYIYDYMISYMSSEIDDIDMDVSTVSTFATVETAWDYILVLIGDFDLEDVRGTLEYNYFVEGEYRGVEIWANDLSDDAVAFIGNMIIYSDKDSVEACIRCHKNEDSSMYDDKDMKSVVDRLPAAIGYDVFGSGYMYNVEILAGGTCVQNQQPDDEVLDITGWYKFDSAASAETALEDIEDEFEYEYDATQISSQLRGQFIELTGEMEIPEY